MANNLYLCIAIIVAPIINFFVIGIWGKNYSKKFTAITSLLFNFISWVIIIYFLINLSKLNSSINWYDWHVINNIKLNLGFLLDRLSIAIVTLVATVSLMVQIYSIDYMSAESNAHYSRFFSYISLFVASMYLLILANNFLQLFIGWELIGLTSYLLIGYWYQKEANNQAALKAFLINRIGDGLLLLAIALLLVNYNSLDYLVILNNLNNNANNINLIAILLLLGAITKSAQMPFQNWLPDAMCAPIPGSALIHAATSVVAGIFLIARVYDFFLYSPYCLNIMLIIGAITTCFMGVIAIVETNIKRILAYSTSSQLGLMLIALGIGNYPLSIICLINHACFKALLFLGSTVSDTTKPIVFWCMLIACVSMAGIPGFSKDLIISSVGLSKLPFANIAYYLLLFSSLITAFYSIRLIFLLFYSNKGLNDNVFNQKNKFINGVFITLAAGCVVFGSFNIFTLNLLNLALLYSILGIILALVLYFYKPHLAKVFKKIIQEDFNWIYNLLLQQYYFNQLNKLIIYFSNLISKIFNQVVELIILEKFLINNITGITSNIARLVVKFQAKELHNYLLLMISGILIILLWILWNIY